MTALLDVYHQLPIEPVRGEGVYLYDADGKRYLDAYGGHAVALLGYDHPRLVAALHTQARALFFQSNVVPLTIRERAAERLLAFGPPGLERVFFSNSGAEANENALRVAFAATGRREVVAVEGAFHGRTAAAAAVTAGSDGWYGFPRAPFDVRWVPFDDVDALTAAVGPQTAALIVEPVQGVAGARDLSTAWMLAARRVTEQAGAALILDEVQCGMGRTGYPFAAQAHGVTPDILTTAKGLGGGFPCAATMFSGALASTLRKGDLGTTFGGGPLAAAMIEVVIDTIERDGLLANVRRLSNRLREEAIGGCVTGAQGMGFLLGLRVDRPAREVLAALRDAGVLAGSAGDPSIVRLLPPLVLDDGHVDAIIAALRGASS